MTGVSRTGTQEHALALEGLRCVLSGRREATERDVLALNSFADALAAETAARERVRLLAKNARSVAAAPDYNEEAISYALWSVVDAALAATVAPVACPECHGDTTIQTAPPYPGPQGHDPQAVIDVTCPVCDGTGDAA